MSRCQHCKKLTHSEHLFVYFDKKDIEKVMELQQLETWIPKYMYFNIQSEGNPPSEYGQLKCGDIVIHFVQKE